MISCVMSPKVSSDIVLKGNLFQHSCEPNLFVQNVFVDSHDPRFPYVGFFVGEK